jgi:hypothetical protein
MEFLLLDTRDGEALLILHKRMREQKELVSVCVELFAGAVAGAEDKKLTDAAAFMRGGVVGVCFWLLVTKLFL